MSGRGGRGGKDEDDGRPEEAVDRAFVPAAGAWGGCTTFDTGVAWELDWLDWAVRSATRRCKSIAGSVVDVPF